MKSLSGNTSRPVIYQVENVRDGASFSTRLVRAMQNAENIFVALISYHRREPSLAEHQFTMPDVKPPEQLLSYDELVRQALAYVASLNLSYNGSRLRARSKPNWALLGVIVGPLRMDW